MIFKQAFLKDYFLLLWTNSEIVAFY